eukprot:TRINITY_DN13370_c0_g1_i1.p1 TRINITY_DN13370_c0_g1~~TRINITY_DN13370_c0_g1_i1.p1  ORF type:complete len:143 (-),score=19.87 TRINITY_DN13370_c0_g1_i1:358-786(-)
MMAVRALQRLLVRNSATTEIPPSTACSCTWVRGMAGLADFFDTVDLSAKETITFGRSWKASELRLKSLEDLQKLWYVLLKEKNVLQTQSRFCKENRAKMPYPDRVPKVRKSMCRIKQVLTERAIQEPDKQIRKDLRRMIDGL